MNENYLLATAGFQNFERDGLVAGFDVQARIAYYRGVALCIFSDIRVSVDGTEYSGDVIRLLVDGREYSLAEMAEEETVRWEYDLSRTVRVLLDGGLAPGRHDVSITEEILPSYMPGPGFLSHGGKQITLPGSGSAHPRIGLGVSLYSYQHEYFTGRMSLEECVNEVAAIGATGVQLLPEQMMPGYPKPPTAWVDRWFGLIDAGGLTPTVLDTFVDVANGNHRRMTPDEALGKLIEQMELAKLLGFIAIRPTTGPVEDAAPDLIRSAVPHAERLEIRILPEIHAPVRLGGALTSSYIDLINETKTQHVGFTLDLGVFCHHMPRARIELARRRGVSEEILTYAEEAYAESTSAPQAIERIKKLGGVGEALLLGMQIGAFGPPSNTIQDLIDVIPYVGNIHAKFYEITDEGVEESVPYPEILAALDAHGYAGSLDSEYEGQRLIADAFEVDSAEQVRRHHLMMRRLLGSTAS